MRFPVAWVLLTASVAEASPHGAPSSDLASRARRAYLAARAECKRPGALLADLVADRFSPEDFGKTVVADWGTRTEAERGALEQIADRVVGGEIRADAVRALCWTGAIETARVQGDGVWISLVPSDDDLCGHHLMFHRDGERWIYDGQWFCGVTSRARSWRNQYGRTYDRAMEELRIEDHR